MTVSLWSTDREPVVYDYATETFCIEVGRITLQTFGFVKREKT